MGESEAGVLGKGMLRVTCGNEMSEGCQSGRCCAKALKDKAVRKEHNTPKYFERESVSSWFVGSGCVVC